MDFWQFVIDFVHYTAWPVVVLVILLVFRKNIGGVLRRIKRVGHGDKFAEFIDYERKTSSSKKLMIYEVSEDSLTWDYYLDLLESFVSCNAMIVRLSDDIPEYGDIKRDAAFRMKKGFEVIQKERPTSHFVSLFNEMLGNM